VGELLDHGDLQEFAFRDPDGNPLGVVWFEEK
jgi:predicted lactoylglutathione lyase